MRFRTLALALALSCGTTVIAEAKQKAPHYKVSKKGKGYKTNRANRVKARKVTARKVKPLKVQHHK